MSKKTIGNFFNLLLALLILGACSSPGGGPTAEPPVTATATNSPESSPTVEVEGPCANEYYPVRQGATWTYKSSGGAAGDYEFTDTISAVGNDNFTLTSTFGDLTRTQRWECRDEGLVALELGGPTTATLSSEDIDLQLDVKNVTGVTYPSGISAGDQWQYMLDFDGTMEIANQTADANGNMQNNFMALGEERVTVPAGTFDAMKVQIDTALNISVVIQGLTVPVTFSGSFNYWLVRGVGWVKASGTGNVAGKAFTESIELQSYDIP